MSTVLHMKRHASHMVAPKAQPQRSLLLIPLPFNAMLFLRIDPNSEFVQSQTVLFKKVNTK